MTAPLKTFIIYASADRELRDEFERHLKPLVDLGWLSLWSDKEIAPGEQWDSTIKRNLHNADIFLMLVSVDFYSSGYIREEELNTAISRFENGDSLVIPIIVRDCPWKYFPVIKDLQVLPPEGKAVTDLEHWKTRDKAGSIVVERIGDRIETLHAERKTKIQAQIEEHQYLVEAEQQAAKAAAQQRARQERLQQQDETAWIAAQNNAAKANTEREKIDAYEVYLDDDKHANHRADAEKAIESLKKAEFDRKLSEKKALEVARRKEEAEAHKNKNGTVTRDHTTGHFGKKVEKARYLC